MYDICFAFILNETETTWFFQHIYYDRAFNCHTIDEAVFYFAFSNGLTYQKSLNIIKKINEADAPAATNYEGNYTLFVKNQINSMKTAGELTTFLISNKENFKSWNKSAGNMLKSLAAEITIPESAKKKTDELKRNISRFLSAPSDKTSCKKIISQVKFTLKIILIAVLSSERLFMIPCITVMILYLSVNI